MGHHAVVVPPPNPLIIVIGSTGTGKSNLAISIAHHLSSRASKSPVIPTRGAEIINADAMQLYTGLPIITNKLSQAEQEDIPHHLLGGVSLHEESWTIHKFVQEADKCIEEIRRRGNIPVVVGGTGYYVHGLLFGGNTIESDDIDAASDGKDIDSKASSTHQMTQAEAEWLLEASTEEMYAKLQEIDPEMAQKWHPNDRRKIKRSLEIWFQSGKKASDVYAAQQARLKTTDIERASLKSAHDHLRYNPLIFWLDAEDSALKTRLDDRVEAMLKRGLVYEAKHLHETAKLLESHGTPVDRSKGIWASIGYKEMMPLLDHNLEEQPGSASPRLASVRDSCIEAVKAGTRRYAKRQNRYIRIRLANTLLSEGLMSQLFLLDCSKLTSWKQAVEDPAASIVDRFLNDEPLPQPEELSDLAKTTFSRMAAENQPVDRLTRRCEACNKTLMTEIEWSKHQRSKGHKKVLEGIRRRAALRDPQAADNHEG